MPDIWSVFAGDLPIYGKRELPSGQSLLRRSLGWRVGGLGWTTSGSTPLVSALAGAAAALAVVGVVGVVGRRRRRRPETTLPPWSRPYYGDTSGAYTRLRVREWSRDQNWRRRNGWHGRDLIHNPDGQAVRIIDYFVERLRQNEQGDVLVGVVYFGPECESHEGLCHGGSFTSVFDDLCGWVGFVFGSGPW